MHHQKHIRKWIAAALVCIIAAIPLTGCASGTGNRMDPMSVNLLKVGKADAIVLQAGDETMVIDTGEEDDGEELVDFLTNQGITQVDVLIITHYDQDHVGGADTLIESMDVKQVYVPAYEGTHTEYVDFLYAMEENGITPTPLTQSVSFSFGDAEVLVEPPASYEIAPNTVENDNNFSLITTVIHGQNRLVFMGDAEKQRIRQWLDSGTAADCDFLKVPHHGVYNTALEDLLNATTPEYAAICSSNKNPAEPETLELLKEHGVETFQTKDGNITVISDGSKLELHQKRK